MPRHTDTIVALATPVGRSALAVIRVSGPDTERLVRAIWGDTPPPRQLRRGDYRDANGKVLDDVMYVFFRAPHSYTAEDSLEISCHGNPLIAQQIIEDLQARGARAPEPGEFTERAFLNGRMDLSQAEAVMDLIQAQGERALEVANEQLRGALSRRMIKLIASLTAVIAEVEAYIDFPDEDLPPADLCRLERELNGIILETKELKSTSRYGDLLRNGVRTVIAGAPNVGKSSLLNRLVGHDRALVSAEPGTTRDYLEEVISIGPYCLRLIDTAGLNKEPGAVERLGMAKTLERIADADLVLAVREAAGKGSSLPPELQSLEQVEHIIWVVNKIDLLTSPAAHGQPVGSEVIGISALTGEGLDALRVLILKKIEKLIGPPDEVVVAINARHRYALDSALVALDAALGKLRKSEDMELLASDLRGALAGFEEIGGKVDNERVLDELFRRFCIGK